MKSSRPRGRKADPDLNISITMLHFWNEVLCLIGSVGFSPYITELFGHNKNYLYSSVQMKMDFQKASGLSKCSLAKFKWAILFFIENRGFFLVTLQCHFNFCLIVGMYIYSRCCQKGELVFTWFIIFLSDIFDGRSLLDRAAVKLNVHHLWIMSYSGWIELQSFLYGLIAFPPDWCP